MTTILPNSFGVEWDTNALLLIDKSQDNLIMEKGTIQSGNNWTITKESYNPMQKAPGDCFASLEAQLGVFYSTNPTRFDSTNYYRTCSEFQSAWKRIIETRQIEVHNTSTVFPVLTTVISHKMPTTTLGTRWSDCERTIPGYNAYYTNPSEPLDPRNLRYQSYVNNLDKITGIPQLTMGFQLQYCLSVWDYTSKLLDNWKTRPDMLGVLKSGMAVQRIATAWTATINQVVHLTSKGESMTLSVSNLILLCNNHLIGLNKHDVKYLKSAMLYKVRTNLRGIYDAFDDNDKELFDKWCSVILHTPGLVPYETPVWSVSDWIEHFYSPLKGYVITHIPDNITTNLSMIGIYSIEPGTLDIMQGWNLKFREVNYISSYRSSYSYILAPRIMLDNMGNLRYVDNTEILNFDVGEWCYNGQIIMELRGMDTIYQLIMAWEKKWFRDPITHITVSGLCSVRKSEEESRQFYFSDIVNNYLNKILYNVYM